MTTYKYFQKSLAALLPVAIAFTLVACSNDDVPGGFHSQNKKTLTFTANEAAQWESTRGAITQGVRSQQLSADGLTQPLYLNTTVADGFQPRQQAASKWDEATRGTIVTASSQINHFGVSAFLQKTTDTELDTPDFFYNLMATRNGNNVFQVDQDFFWPASDECLHFYAYYPYGDANVVISDDDQEGPQSIDFTVDTDVADQVDLMTAVSVDNTTRTITSTPSISLPFRHELCAISFKIDTQFPSSGGIVSVALKNLYGAGTMTINQNAAGTWDFTGKTANTSFTAVIDKTDTQNLSNGKLIADNLTFLMIPQELSDAAVIEMVYQDQVQNYRITASLKEALKITDSNDANYGKAFFEAGKTITFALSSTTLTTLKIGTVQWPSDASYTSVGVSLPKSTYNDGDMAGLYAVAANNTDIVYQNIPVTYDALTQKWIINHATSQGTVYYNDDYHYYLYYPYTPTPDTDYPLAGQGAGESTADTYFFSTLIRGWGRKLRAPGTGEADHRDQSQAADFTAYDLHIGELTQGSLVSTVGGQMKHAMGLAVFVLEQKTLDKKKTYSLSTDAYYQFIVKTGTATVTASGSFNGVDHIPYKNDNTHYYYWVDPGTTYSVASSGTDNWSESVNVATNTCTAYNEPVSRTYVDDGTATHVLAVGDVFFSDGSVGTTYTAYPYDTKTPVGIVYALGSKGGGSGISTADETAGFKHAYVVAGKDASSGAAWTSLSTNDVSGIPNVTWSATTDMSVTENVIKNLNGTGQDGRANTSAIGVSNSSYPAFQALATFRSTTAPISAAGTSDWFIPSIAQMWAFCKNLGGMDTSKRSNDTSWKDGSNSLWGVYYSNPSADNVRETLNTYLERLGSGNYEYFHGGAAAGKGNSAASNVGYWSSSEWSGAGYAFLVYFHSNGNLGFHRYDAKSHAFRVRPVLAF